MFNTSRSTGWGEGVRKRPSHTPRYTPSDASFALTAGPDRQAGQIEPVPALAAILRGGTQAQTKAGLQLQHQGRQL